MSCPTYERTQFSGYCRPPRSTFAMEGARMKVYEEVERVLKEFSQESKPIG